MLIGSMRWQPSSLLHSLLCPPPWSGQAWSCLPRYRPSRPPPQVTPAKPDDRIRLGENAEPLWDPSLMDGALSLALGRYNAKGLGPNLRRNGFEVQKRSFYRSKIFRKVAAWLLVIASLWAIDIGVDTYFLKQRAAALDSRTLVLFKKTFPHISRIVDPVKQAQIEINELKRVSKPGQAVGM